VLVTAKSKGGAYLKNKNQVTLFDENSVNKINGDYQVVKENTVIRASYDLNLYEHRVLAVVAAQIKPTDEMGQHYFFRISDFAEYFKLDSKKIYTIIKDTLLKLRSRSFVIERPREGRRVTGWINWAEIIPSTGCVEVAIDDRIRPFFLEIKATLGYTKYQLKYIRDFQNPYAFRFYERFKTELQNKKEIFFYLPLEDLKKWLSIEKQYKLYADLKKRVLVPAIEDINGERMEGAKTNRKRSFKNNEGSDIFVTFEENRPGRKVLGITFNIKLIKEEMENPITIEVNPEIPDSKFNEFSVEQRAAFNTFVKTGVDKEIIFNAIEEHGLENLIYMEKYFKKRKATANDPAGYMVAILQNGWGLPQSVIEKKSLQNEVQEVQDAEQIIKAQEQVAVAEEVNARELVEEYLSKLSASEKQKLAEECKKYQEGFGEYYKVEKVFDETLNASRVIFDEYVMKNYINKR
jgi:plasmid replication initiation protein